MSRYNTPPVNCRKVTLRPPLNHSGRGRRVSYLSLLALLCVLSVARAQQQQSTSVGCWEYGSEFFRSPDQTFALLEDRNGCIWSAGSGARLFRYDGVNRYTLGNDEGVDNAFTFQMYEDAHERIWLLQWRPGLSWLKDDTVRQFPGNHVLERLMEDRRFPEFIYVDSGDSVWLTSRKQQQLYQCWGDTAVRVRPFAWEVSWDSLVCLVRQFSGGDLIVYSNTGRIRRPRLRRVSEGYHISGGIDRSGMEDHRTFLRLSDGGLLLTFGSRIYLFDTGRASPVAEGSIPNDIEFSFEDRDGDIWFGTTDGVYRFRGRRITSSQPDHLFPGRYINYVMQDRVGGFWLADRDHGVYYIPDGRFRSFRLVQSRQRSGAGLSRYNSRMPTVPIIALQSVGQDVWFGDGRGNVYRMDTAGTCSLVVDGPMAMQTNVESSDFVRDYDGRVYFGQRMFVASPPYSEPRYLDKGAAKTYLLLSDGRVAIGKGVGFEIYDGYRKVFDSETIGFESWVVRMVQDDRDGSLIVCSAKGAFRYQTGRITPWRHGPSGFQEEVLNLTYTPDRSLSVLSTAAGIVVMGEDGRIDRLGNEEGLISEKVSKVYCQNDTVWWAATAGGLSRISVTSRRPFRVAVRTYTSQNGLPGDDVHDILLHQGRLWLATDGGLCEFDPDALRLNVHAPPVSITGLTINDSVALKDRLQSLAHDENNIGIEFLGICFRRMGNVRYRYRLIGWERDSTWKETSDRSLQFLSLPPGEYRFEVTAANEDGVWNPDPAWVEIHIAPHFTETLWFGFAVLALLLISAGGVAWKIVAYQQKRFALDAQMRELRQKALAANMNPHFIFNSLSSIQDYINQHNPFEANEYLVRFSRLIRLNMESVRKSLVPVSEELERLELYLALEKLRFGERMEYRIEIDDRIDPDEIFVPTMLIQPYVENAIWHGILPLQRKGSVVVDVAYRGESTFALRILDNGVGIHHAEPDSSLKWTSMSMQLNRERLDLLARSTNLPFSISVTERHDNSGAVCGTVVEIILPGSIPHDVVSGMI